jgi:hypothetical protein
MIRVTGSKPHAILRDGINMRRRYIPAAVHTHIRIPQIIGQNNDNVGLGSKQLNG